MDYKVERLCILKRQLGGYREFEAVSIIRTSTERQLRADIKVEGGGILWSTSSVYLFLYT